MRLKETLIITTILVVSMIVAACTPLPTTPGATPDTVTTTTMTDLFSEKADLEAKTFTTLTELEAFLQENQQSSNYYGSMLMRGGGMMEESMAVDVVMDSTAPAPATTTKTQGSDDFSETNNQVQGVDEGDIIKTDGEYIYTVSGTTLFIVKAYPGEDAELITTMTFEKGSPQGLFINGDDLIVYGRVTDYDLFDELDMVSRTTMTYLDVYDMSDKQKVELEKEYLFEGSYFESRMIGDYVYLVTQDYPQYGGRPLPLLVEDGIARDVPISSIRYFPLPYDSVSFVTINAIDLASLRHESRTLAVEGSRELYMSENNIYFAYTKYINEWEITQDVTVDLVTPMLSGTDRDLIKKIRGADNDILSHYEKEQKVMSIISRYVEFLSRDDQESLQEKIELQVRKELESYDYFEYTIVHRVKIEGLDIDPEASGQVPGHVNNQFSMDEHKDVLRMATTLNARWSNFKDSRTESENFVFTLDEDLEVLDSLEGIAPGERIYSTRFMQDRLYMVTFRQVDPFFVIDLADAEDIKELGELKIPGFSRYLHPYDENHIIGLGRDATETGRTQGLKISIFDVTDVKNPEEVAQWVSKEKYASSTAEYEHKAFLFSKEKSLLVIPAYSYDYRDGDYEGYNGALVFDIDKDDIELRGLIDHSKAAQNRWGSAVERSLYIDDMLYTKSYSLLRINALDDLEGVNDIELEQKNAGDIPLY